MLGRSRAKAPDIANGVKKASVDATGTTSPRAWWPEKATCVRNPTHRGTTRQCHWSRSKNGSRKVTLSPRGSACGDSVGRVLCADTLIGKRQKKVMRQSEQLRPWLIPATRCCRHLL